MDYVNLGKSGLKVSRIGLGMMSFGSPEWSKWVLDEDQSRPIIKHAVEQGINFFDTADAYSYGVSEQITGRALKDFCRREEIVVATKVYVPHSDKPNMGGLSRKHIMASIDFSLKNLGMDYVDLYQIHRFDYNTPIEETLEALHDLVKAGKVRYIGASSIYGWQMAKMIYTSRLNGWTEFISMQNHYNLLYREEERDMNPLCVDQNIGLIPWSPVARGMLARASREKDTTRSQMDSRADMWYKTEANDTIITRAIELAEKKEATLAQIALAWLLHKPNMTAPIIGATKAKYIDDAVGALAVQLSAEDIIYLEEPYEPRPIIGHGYPADN